MIFFYLFIFLFVEINNQCDKETPIRKSDNNCYITYCTEIEFQNGNCIIDNPIIKTQWLNKLIYLGDYIIDVMSVIEMPNNNIFFLSSLFDQDYLYIYRLKSSDEIYYNENNNNFKIIPEPSFHLPDGSEDLQLSFINGVGLIIDNKEYLFICQFDRIQCQLIEFGNNIIFNQYLTEILNINELYNRLSSLFTILNLNQNNQILLSFIHGYKSPIIDGTNYFYLDLSIINMKKDILSYEIKHLSKIEYAFDEFYDISCFLTVKNFV